MNEKTETIIVLIENYSSSHALLGLGFQRINDGHPVHGQRLVDQAMDGITRTIETCVDEKISMDLIRKLSKAHNPADFGLSEHVNKTTPRYNVGQLAEDIAHATGGVHK